LKFKKKGLLKIASEGDSGVESAAEKAKFTQHI